MTTTHFHIERKIIPQHHDISIHRILIMQIDITYKMLKIFVIPLSKMQKTRVSSKLWKKKQENRP